MKNVDIIRAWKDKSYRASLTAEQLAQVEANPAGELSNVEQELVAGGTRLTYDWAYTCGWGRGFELGCGEVR